MKIPLFRILLPFVMGSAMAAETTFIRQIQSIVGVNVVSDISTGSDIGEVTSGMLSSDLAVFQLYTTYINEWKESTLVKLDEKSVGTFLPKVTIDITSEDPYQPRCTRADRPYGVTVTVSGLLAGPLVPDYAKTVLVGSGYKLYSLANYVPTGEVGDYTESWTYRANGTYLDPAVIQHLAGGTLAVGAETYSAKILPGAGIDDSQLASAEIIVWPVAMAAIEGIESTASGKVYYSWPEEGRIKLNYAYPRSTTYAQIYKGPPVLGTTGTVVSSTVTQYNTAVPQDTTVAIGSMADYIMDDGEYTLEVLTVTPFNKGAPERLAYISFMIDRTITVNGMVSTSE